jgi:hypothetical protein
MCGANPLRALAGAIDAQGPTQPRLSLALPVGDWCPVFYPAEARRKVAPKLVADSKESDNSFGRENQGNRVK